MFETKTLVMLGATVLVLSSPLLAQDRTPVTGARVMQTLRESGSVGRAQRTLQQLDGSVSQAAQDDLADSLVAFVLGDPARTRSKDGVRGPIDGVVDALGLAGIPGAAGPEGEPYVGACVSP